MNASSESSGRASRLILAATVLGAGIVLAAAVFGFFFYQTRAQDDTVRVVGAATQRFEADVVKWRLTLRRQVPPAGLTEGYARIGTDVDRLVTRLRGQGVADTSIVVEPPNSYPNHNQQGTLTGYNFQQSLYVLSGAVDSVEALALAPGSLLEGGVVLQQSQLEYYYSEIDSLKRSLLAQATGDARARAREIAQSSGIELGRMLEARAGVFQITEPYSTEVSSYGVYNTSTRKKEITVTVHAAFTME